MEGIFTISLDFELHWGAIGIKDPDKHAACYKNTTGIVIPRMLELFAEYDVHATWAAVGGLFAKDKEEWKELCPRIKPLYTDEKHDPYKWIELHGLNERQHWAYFAPETIKSILKHPNQEVGTHTFSHFYCWHHIGAREAFLEDLQSSNKAAAKFGFQPLSLVFPKNQVDPSYLRSCYDAGIRIVRSNPNAWFHYTYQGTSNRALKQFVRKTDHYIPLSSDMCYPLELVKASPNEPLQVPRGRLVPAWNPKKRISITFRVRRLIQDIHAAAVRKKSCHFWWHPEDFGDYPEENLKNLKMILDAYGVCKKKYGMKSWNMVDYTTHLPTSS